MRDWFGWCHNTQQTRLFHLPWIFFTFPPFVSETNRLCALVKLKSRSRLKNTLDAGPANAWPSVIDGPFADKPDCLERLTIRFLTSFRLVDGIIHAAAVAEEAEERWRLLTGNGASVWKQQRFRRDAINNPAVHSWCTEGGGRGGRVNIWAKEARQSG